MKMGLLELMVQTVLIGTKDHADGVGAFVEKRDTKFLGR
jgi:hypothetical protein